MESLFDNELTRNKILLNWINFYLKQKRKKIRNFGALADGIILADLLEILSQSALPERFLMLTKVKEENALSNIKICLDFIRSKITITINPLDVFNEKDQPEGRIIRDLIWNLILYYHFGTSSKFPVVKLKEKLTKFITECGISLERDIIHDMLDGTLIFKLAPVIQPQLIIPRDVKAKPICNLQKAVKLATRKLFMPEIMSFEDFEPTKVDDIAILIYLGFFINTIKGEFFPQIDAYRRKQSKENPLRSPRTVRIAQFLESTESLPPYQPEIESLLCQSESSRIQEKSNSSQAQRVPFSQIDCNKGTGTRSGLPRSKSSKKNYGLKKSLSESEISSAVFGNTDIKIYNQISPRYNFRGAPPRPASPPICEERTFEELASRSEVPLSTSKVKELSKSDAPPRPETPRPLEGLYRHENNLSKSEGPGLPPRPERRPPPVPISTPSTSIRRHTRTVSRTDETSHKRSWSKSIDAVKRGNSRPAEIRAIISPKTPMQQNSLSRTDTKAENTPRRPPSRSDVPPVSPRGFSSNIDLPGGKENIVVASDKRKRSNSAKPMLLDHQRQKIPLIAMKSAYVLHPPVGMVGLGQILKLKIDTVKSKLPNINLFSARVYCEGSELSSQLVEVDSVYYIKFCVETSNMIQIEVKFNDRHVHGSPLQIKAFSTEVPQILSPSQATTDESTPIQVVGITECTTGKVGVIYTKPIPSSFLLDPSQYIIEVNGPPYQNIEVTGVSSSGLELSFHSNNTGLYYIRILSQERKFVSNIFVKSKESQKEKPSLLKFMSEKTSEIPKPSNSLIKAELEDFQFLSTQIKSEESTPDFKLENNLSEESSLRSPSYLSKYIPPPPPENESVKIHPLIRLLTPDSAQGERVRRPRPTYRRSPTAEEITKPKTTVSDSVKRAPTFTNLIRKSLQELSFQKPLEIVRIKSPPPQPPAASSLETDKGNKTIDMDADYFHQMVSLQQQLHNIRSIRVSSEFYCESLSIMADKLTANLSTLFQVTDVDYITLLALSIEKQFRFASEIFKIYRSIILVLLNAEQLEQDEKRAQLLESANVLHQHSTTLLKVIRSILEDTQNGADHKNYTVALSETKTLLPKLIRSIQ